MVTGRGQQWCGLWAFQAYSRRFEIVTVVKIYQSSRCYEK
jgi:hypothetical protein